MTTRGAVATLAGLVLAALAPPEISAAPAGGVVRVEHRAPTSLPSRGPLTAPVTVELFFTPGQTSRAQAYQYIEKLQAAHPTKIRIVYRVLNVNGQARLPYLALEAFAEGKFFELMERLNCSQCRSRYGIINKEIAELGDDLGLDPDRLAAAMSGRVPEYERVLAANDRRRKQRFHNTALPNALFNGRPPQTQLSALGMADLEREYVAARARAEDLLDRGAEPDTLPDAFDDEAAPPPPQDLMPPPGPTDDELDQLPAEPPLASPPLRLEGLPSFGPANAAVTIVVLCSPLSDKCLAPRHAARLVQESYPDSVRVLWAPFFDPQRDDAAELGMLGDAALCAEQVGTSSEDEGGEPSSSGWRWVDRMLAEANNRRLQRPPTDQLINRVAQKLRVEPHAFASCRAKLAGTTLQWAVDARRSGVRTTPATVVGGRLYGPVIDDSALRQLVEVELAPGLLGEHAPTWRRRL